MEITLTVPDTLAIDGTPEEVGRRILRMAALMMFGTGEMSAGGAAELAGMDRFAFAAECARLGIPLVDYPPDELDGEIALMRPASGRRAPPG
jgi:predicted HTH domain antitoxin